MNKKSSRSASVVTDAARGTLLGLLYLLIAAPVALAQQTTKPSDKTVAIPILRITMLEFSGASAGDGHALFSKLHGKLRDTLLQIISRVSQVGSDPNFEYIKNLELYPYDSASAGKDNLKNEKAAADLLVKSASLILVRGLILEDQASKQCCISPSYSFNSVLHGILGSAVGPVPEEGGLNLVADVFQVLVLLALALDAERVGKDAYIVNVFLSDAKIRLADIQKYGRGNDQIARDFLTWIDTAEKTIVRIGGVI